MKKSSWALLVVAFAFGLTTADANTQPYHHHKKMHAKHAHKAHKKRHAMASYAGSATVVAHIDVSSQRMNVSVGGDTIASWPVSTARAGYHTPRGTYGAIRLARVYYSKKYDNSPMPNSVFFHGGYAIHGTYHTGALGRPASHGCVRLAPGNAAELFSLVQRYGMSHTRIVITN